MPTVDVRGPSRQLPSDAPRVTIGLPTYNGEAFLEAALESLVSQDHENLEIVVWDNASNDRTPAIVRQFADRDPRVRWQRSETHVSAAQNFNGVFRATSGTYFMWAADDDLRDASYVHRCLAALESNPDAVMACTSFRFIDPAGGMLDRDYARYDNPDLSSPSVVERVRLLLRRGGWYEVYGLARRDALERTHLFQNTYGPDVMLVLELAMLGPILLVPETLFFFRAFPDRTEHQRAERQGGIADIDSVLATRLTYLQESMSATVAASALPWRLKLRLRWEILWAVYVADTPIGGNARKELRARIVAARRTGDVRAYVKFGAFWLLDRRRVVATLPGRLVARARRWVGRLRRRVLARLRAG